MKNGEFPKKRDSQQKDTHIYIYIYIYVCMYMYLGGKCAPVDKVMENQQCPIRPSALPQTFPKGPCTFLLRLRLGTWVGNVFLLTGLWKIDNVQSSLRPWPKLFQNDPSHFCYLNAFNLLASILGADRTHDPPARMMKRYVYLYTVCFYLNRIDTHIYIYIAFVVRIYSYIYIYIYVHIYIYIYV